MKRTHLILDGLQDAELGRQLSAKWHAAGFLNAVDVSGQYAWIARAQDNGETELTEASVDVAANIARAFGLEVRDRVGSTFVADNDLDGLRKRMVFEYKSRFATAMMFGLPALALHYLGPILAGGGRDPRSMAYPWVFELALVGWVCIAAGWPILWQGALSLIHLRPTADLLTSLLVLVAFVPSALGLMSMSWRDLPWFDMITHGGTFYIAMLAVTLAVLQRWQAHASAARLSGRADWLPRGFSRVVLAWIGLSAVVWMFGGREMALAVALLLPPMIGLGAVNRVTPGLMMLLPIFGFAVFFVLAPDRLRVSAGEHLPAVAAGFQLLMTIVMALLWRGMKAGTAESENR